jgi:hypothetical protein
MVVRSEMEGLPPANDLANSEAKIRWERFTEPYRDPDTKLLPAGFRRGSNQTHPDVSGEEGDNVIG